MPDFAEMGPDKGLTPYLTVDGGAEAVEFYKRAFGAREIYRNPDRDGRRLVHAHLKINGASLMLCDDFPEQRDGAPQAPPARVMLHLQVDDADAWVARAVDAGCILEVPLADMFWGDRFGRLRDPFGHLWSIACPTKT